jgi:glycosyltransferase involved in cell wall biosynthesis
MYLSCPVVCSDIPIFREIGFNRCTYFSLVGDPVNNLAQAIAQALEQLRPSQRSGDYRFSKSNAAGQYLKFYSTVINNTTNIAI